MAHVEWVVLLIYATSLPAAGWLSYRLRDWHLIAFAGLLSLVALPVVDSAVGIADLFAARTGHLAAAKLRGAFWLASGVAMPGAVALLGLTFWQNKMASLAAAKNEQRLRDFAEAASDWLWETDADLRYTYVSPNVKDIIGVDPKWLLGKAREVLIGSDTDRSMWDEHPATLRAHRPYKDFIFQRVGADVETRWLRSSAKPFFDNDGRFLGYRGVGSDATDDLRMQHKIAEMEKRFRVAIGSMDQGFALFDEGDRLIAWNSRFEEINADLADLIETGASYSGLAAATATRRRLGSRWYEATIEKHREGGIDVIKRFPDGRWMRIQDQKGDDGSSVVVLTDVSELKQTEQALAETVRELRTITDNVPVIIAHVDTEERFRFINKLAELWYGCSREDLVGRRLAEIQPPDTYAKMHARMQAALAGETVHFDATVQYPDGIFRDVEITYIPELDGDGNVCGFFGLGVDVSEHRRLDRERLRSEQKVADLVAGSLQGIWVIDRDWRLLFANPAVATMFGYDDGEALHALGSVEALLAPDEVERLAQYRDRCMRGDDVPSVIEFEGRTKDGGRVWLTAMSRRVDWEGVPAVLTSLIDVTDRHRAEEELRHAQKMEAVGQLTGGIAHDFNNMLTVIQGNADMLCDMLEPSSQHAQLAAAVLGAAERSAELTQRLLAFSRQQSLSPKSVDVGSLLSGMSGLLSRTLAGNIDVQIRAEPDIAIARVDPGQLESAVLNLAINARDAMPDGGTLVLAARTTHVDGALCQGEEAIAPGRYVEVSVSDTGTGMPEDVAARAFDPFFTTKELGHGTGLGLSMVYGFARQSDGVAQIYTEPGHGTTIKLLLPVADASAAAEAAGAAWKSMTGSETVLVIEDNNDIAAFAELALTRLGYEVVVADDGMQGLACLRGGQRFDLLLTDVVLPGEMNGRQVANAARALCPGIKVLFMSGYTRDALGAGGRIDSGLTFLPKPFTASLLVENVRAVLDGEAA